MNAEEQQLFDNFDEQHKLFNEAMAMADQNGTAARSWKRLAIIFMLVAFLEMLALVSYSQSYQDHMNMIENYGGRVVVVEDYTRLELRGLNIYRPVYRPYYPILYRPVRWNAIYSYIPLKIPNLWKLEDYYDIGKWNLYEPPK